MKKIFLLLIFINFINIINAQDNNLLDNGHYVGIYNDTINKEFNYYIYLKYLNKSDDNLIIILPYKYYLNSDKNIMKKIVLNKLKYLSEINDLESKEEILNKKWTIVGFDNFPHFTINDNKISFSLNIANIETYDIEVFTFDGFILNDKKEINAIIYSDKNTFMKKEIKFKFIENEK